MAQITVAESAAPATPATGYVTMYAKTDGRLYSKDDAGTETAFQNTGKIVQAVQASKATAVSCTTAMPWDDTIPVNTEGDEVITASISPSSATNNLYIQFVSSGGADTASIDVSFALFQDSTANALTSGATYCVQDHPVVIALNHFMAAGTTSATTFKIRVGPSANRFTVNGYNGSRKFGGVSSTQLWIWEISS